MVIYQPLSFPVGIYITLALFRAHILSNWFVVLVRSTSHPKYTMPITISKYVGRIYFKTNVKQQTHEKSLNDYVIKTHLFHGLFCVCDMLSTAPCVCVSYMQSHAWWINGYLEIPKAFGCFCWIIRIFGFKKKFVCRFSFLNHTQDANWNAHLPAMFIHPSAKNT